MPLLYGVAYTIKMSKKGLCVQCMHAGPYDDEPATIDAMHVFAAPSDRNASILADVFRGRLLALLMSWSYDTPKSETRFEF